MVRIRNPWGVDRYTGPWCDGDSRWTAAYQAQVPYNNNQNDGYFFMNVNDFVNAFSYFQINYINDGWNTNYYRRTSDDGTTKSYTFTLARQQNVYVAMDFYNPRMYAAGCRGGQQTTGSYKFLKGSSVLDQYSFND